MERFIDLDADNVYQTDLTVSQTRTLLDQIVEGYDDLVSELDEAQGKVFGGGAEIAYLVITIVK